MNAKIPQSDYYRNNKTGMSNVALANCCVIDYNSFNNALALCFKNKKASEYAFLDHHCFNRWLAVELCQNVGNVAFGVFGVENEPNV